MTAADATARDALARHPIVDGHNDWPWALREGRDSSLDGLDSDQSDDFHTDVPRLAAGGVGGQFWSVYVEDRRAGAEHVRETLEQIDVVHRLARRYPDHFTLARSAADFEEARSRGTVASFLGAEGSHQLDGSLAVLRQYARLGVRYLTLTHWLTSEFADSATDDPQHGGLSDRGRELVRELGRLGMLVDLSHVATTTMHDALDEASAPVIFSHSSCRAVTDHVRNVPDDVLERIPGNDGVVMITFVPQFVSDEYRLWLAGGREGDKPRVTVADVADHVEHARAVAGVDHLGLGGDFDGTPDLPSGLESVAGYPKLLAELARRGWSAADLAKLAGGNIMRVVRATDAAFQASA
ncbi:dipeptidase [Gryllotalpicola protaetiae]|uniref:Membrane dipeptidase n=1 Tax=Gryllotalpicola protaetiae TaxID=2419771 RepID=A0A387C4B5_9MICO|nr:dipeptidase [Gryllotalpicola protaetiae]AYG05431.1 membrane dipeptidase [Gryllotalpicola protaetiae]